MASVVSCNKYCLGTLLNDFEKALNDPTMPSSVYKGLKIDYKIWREWTGITKLNPYTMIEFSETYAPNCYNATDAKLRLHVGAAILGHIYGTKGVWEETDDVWFLITTKHGSLFDYLLERNSFNDFPSASAAAMTAVKRLIDSKGLVEWSRADWEEAMWEKKEPPNENMNFVNSEPQVIQPGEYAIKINNNSSSWINTAPSSGNIFINKSNGDIVTADGAIIDTSTTLKSAVDDIEERVTKLEKENENTMDTNKVLNFDFGPVSTSVFRLSPYGIAANMGDRWVAYDKNKGDIMDVEVFNFKMDRVIYKVPAPITALKPGDMIIHQKIPMFVKSIDNVANTVEAINFRDCTVSNILPVKSPFGFNFITKIISFIDMGNMSPDADNPFGNMLPLMLLGDQENSKMDPLLLCMMMQGGQMDFSNPMMMYFMLQGDNNNDNLLPLMFMMQNK